MNNGIAQRINDIKSRLPEGVTLVAVSKFHPDEAIMQAYNAGHRVFGESRAVELTGKAERLPKDIEWHFIGHLQTNKVRAILPHVKLIHSVDSERLLRFISAEALRIGTVADVLLQLHVAAEETKFGFTPDELIQLAKSGVINDLNGVRVRGVMGMASNTDDENRINADFSAIRATFDKLISECGFNPDSCNIVSMGMSHDYPIAIRCGGNMVRIGTTIFGEREY